MNGVEGQVGNLELGMVIMGVSALMNLIVSTRLMRLAKRTDSVALEADALHLRTDVYTLLAVCWWSSFDSGDGLGHLRPDHCVRCCLNDPQGLL